MPRRTAATILLALSLLLAGLAPATAMAAAAARLSAIGHGSSHILIPSIYGSSYRYAGTFSGTRGGASTQFYCVGLRHPLVLPSDYDSAGASTDERLTYLFNNYYPKKTGAGALAVLNEEAAAVQIAVWHYTDALAPASVKVPAGQAVSAAIAAEIARIRTRAAAIISATDAGAPRLASSMSVAVTGATDHGASVTAVVVNAAKLPVPGVTVAFAASGPASLSAASAVTDAAGTATVALSRTGQGAVTASASYAYSRPAMTVYKPAAGSASTQNVGAASAAVPVSLTGSAPVSFAAAAPSISTRASGATTLGKGTVSDTATLSGGFAPGGSIRFALYGPDAADCGGSPVFSDTVAVSGAGAYTSRAFSPTRAGTYRWVAAYSGDGANAAVSGACGDSGESVAVAPTPTPVPTSTPSPTPSPTPAPTPAPTPRPSSGLHTPPPPPHTTPAPSARPEPSLATTAANTVHIAGALSDTAVVTGAGAGGRITFSLYGPDDEACSRTPVFTGAVPAARSGRYTSGAYLPERPGVYRWVAVYTDTAGHRVAGPCGLGAETSTVWFGASPAPAASGAAGAPSGSAGAAASQSPSASSGPGEADGAGVPVPVFILLFGGALAVIALLTVWIAALRGDRRRR